MDTQTIKQYTSQKWTPTDYCWKLHEHASQQRHIEQLNLGNPNVKKALEGLISELSQTFDLTTEEFKAFYNFHINKESFYSCPLTRMGNGKQLLDYYSELVPYLVADE